LDITIQIDVATEAASWVYFNSTSGNGTRPLTKENYHEFEPPVLSPNFCLYLKLMLLEIQKHFGSIRQPSKHYRVSAFTLAVRWIRLGKMFRTNYVIALIWNLSTFMNYCAFGGNSANLTERVSVADSKT
jgi:hypothetical protein